MRDRIDSLVLKRKMFFVSSSRSCATKHGQIKWLPNNSFDSSAICSNKDEAHFESRVWLNRCSAEELPTGDLVTFSFRCTSVSHPPLRGKTQSNKFTSCSPDMSLRCGLGCDRVASTIHAMMWHFINERLCFPFIWSVCGAW